MTFVSHDSAKLASYREWTDRLLQLLEESTSNGQPRLKAMGAMDFLRVLDACDPPADPHGWDKIMAAARAVNPMHARSATEADSQ